MPQALEFYRRLLAVQAEVQPSASVSSLSVKEREVDRHVKQGKPILRWDSLALDWEAVQGLLGKVISLVLESLSPDPDELATLNRLVVDQVYLESTAKAWFEGGTPLSGSRTQGEELSPLVCSAIHTSLQPFLAAYSERLLALVKQEAWHKGYCPVCGGEPDISFLDKARGSRWLVCSRCDAEWLFYRLVCPYCGTKGHKNLAYFSAEKGPYRLYVCEECHRYIKAVDLRRTVAEALLPLERILTLDMDRQACEMGYKPAA